MKKVWIIDHYSSEPKYGGISRQYDFANELSKRGYEVVIISSLFSHFTHRYIEEDMFISKINEKVHYVYLKTTPYTENNNFSRLKNMLSFHNEVVKNMQIIADKFGIPDVVNGCSVHPFAWTAAYMVAKKFNAKYCVEVRDLWPEVWVLSGKKKRTNPMVWGLGLLEKWVYIKADKIIYSMSKGEKYISGKLNIPREKTMLIGQPMDCDRFDYNAANNYDLVPEEIRLFMQDFFVCTFAGYYMTYEGVYTMLEAAKALQELNVPIKMVFVGSGEEKDDMKKYVSDNNLNNVFIGDRISKEAIPALLKNSDVVMAHLAELGHEEAYKYGVSKNKVNEYLYSGAVTLYGFYDTQDVVATANAGYIFEPYNSSDLVKYIMKIYKMTPERRTELGNNGRNCIINNHSSEVLTDRLETVLF